MKIINLNFKKRDSVSLIIILQYVQPFLTTKKKTKEIKKNPLNTNNYSKL